MTRPLLHLALALTTIGAAVSCRSHGHQAATPQTSSTPTTSASPNPRETPTAASRSRSLTEHRQPADPGTSPSNGTGSLNWTALRQCENSGSYHSRPHDHYRGAYQFDQRTWRTVGGTGDPATATPAEQDLRARRLYAQRGRQPWPVCGRRL